MAREAFLPVGRKRNVQTTVVVDKEQFKSGLLLVINPVTTRRIIFKRRGLPIEEFRGADVDVYKEDTLNLLSTEDAKTKKLMVYSHTIMCK